MIKTVEELRTQAATKNINWWPVRECSICGSPIGYYIEDDTVSFDPRCGCGAGGTAETRSWNDLAYSYNLNQPENNPGISKGYLAKVNQTWQFKEEA